MRPRRAGARCALLSLLQFGLAGRCAAHGFGQRFDLPLPLWLYLSGAALTVAFTFVMLALRTPGKPWSRRVPWRPRGAGKIGTLLRGLVRGLVLALYLLVIYAGLTGSQNPVKNIAPAMIWAVWWVGMAYVSALLGNLWAIVNPLDTVFRWGERAWRRFSGVAPRALLRYPRRLGTWPATLLFFLFVWVELNWEGSERPASLARAMLVYSASSWCAMLLFGRASWLRHGEVFAVVFRLLARFAPNHIEYGEWRMRPFAAALLTAKPVGLARIVLVVLMLASVSVDGMMETEPWLALLARLPPPALAWANGAALLLAPAILLLVFLGCCRLVAAFGGATGPGATLQTAGLYVLTLVPIAIAYHFAHYLSFLAMAGQYLIPLASDPLNLGWDLFGTRLYFIRLGIVDARMVWYVSLFAIVAGHVAAVWLAHLTALRQFATRGQALRSQLPMLALMVGYTLLSLWIIAQPIVVR
jgi:hypothetical protein